MMKIFPGILLLLFSNHLYSQQLTRDQALYFARLPLHCIGTEYPNKTGHLINDSTDAVLTPSKLHPSFYGCLDWHSSVHGHWLLVKVLKSFPTIAVRDSVIEVLQNSFNAENVNAEAGYFDQYKNSASFERTYGWAWLLKLDQELYEWNDPLAKEWRNNLQPLTNKIVDLWKKYLPKQTYPNRTGVHPNTAFGLVFALDWARALKDTSFSHAIIAKAKYHYLNNIATPAYLEPDGTDFLSPSLEIADLMTRVLSNSEYVNWFNKFYEQRSINRIISLPVVSDRTDMLIVHLDGLALSRAWCMRSIAKKLPVNHPVKKLFTKTAEDFLNKALPNVSSGNYGGDHWLASFAVYALSMENK